MQWYIKAFFSCCIRILSEQISTSVTRAYLAVYIHVQTLLEAISVLATMAIVQKVMGKDVMVN